MGEKEQKKEGRKEKKYIGVSFERSGLGMEKLWMGRKKERTEGKKERKEGRKKDRRKERKKLLVRYVSGHSFG